ncbi:MAG: HlyD family efflux transporter periplasmic adaptor subunit [Lutispora sp.]|nr:HlyD family efflux transporter periplasmic adaptor subunit [Lutispora sp.]
MKNRLLLIPILILFASCANGTKDFDASGVFEAKEIIVSSEVNGKILSLNIEEGQEHEQGQEYGLIDTLQLYLKRQQLLYSIEAIGGRAIDVNTQIASLKEQISKMKVEKQRIETLLKKNAANQKQLDDINSNISVAEKQLLAQVSSFEKGNKSISSEESSFRVQVLQINDQLEKCKIKSPIKGRVLLKYSEQGEILGVGRPIFKISDVDNMILRIYITSSQLTQVKLDQEIKVFADFGKERKEYKGKISWISSKAEFTPKSIQVKDDRDNLVYAVKVMVKNDGYLKIGMYGDVKL